METAKFLYGFLFLFRFFFVILLGSAPSCSSTPPPAFDDISEHGGFNNQNKHLSNDYSSSDKRLNSSPRTSGNREDSVR